VRPQIDRTLARLFGRHDSDYDDLRQLALIELVFNIERFRGECSLDTWVSTLTARVVFKHLRHRQTERRMMTLLARDELLPQTSIGSSRQPLLRSAMVRAAQHLEAIDPNKAWAFVLHDVLGYDLSELAKTMGISVSAAQTRLVRGRRDVHERLAADPDLAGLLDEIQGWP
jgi:RNA polymerase sigma-70 factor (ECF subfamily)